MSAHLWRLCRRSSPRPDGQQRWDRAYRYVVQWTQPPQPYPGAILPRPRSASGQEEDHDDRSSLCARLDPAPSADPND